jgi:hypothetical protein
MSIEMKKLRYSCEFVFSSSQSSSYFTNVLPSIISMFLLMLPRDNLQLSLPIHFNYQLASLKKERNYKEVSIPFPYFFIRSAPSFADTGVPSLFYSVTQKKSILSRSYRYSYLNKENERGHAYLFSYLASAVLPSCNSSLSFSSTCDSRAEISNQYHMVQFPMDKETENHSEILILSPDLAYSLFKPLLSVQIPIGNMNDYMIVSHATYSLIVFLQVSLIFHLVWRIFKQK